jgi:hypothetical protein
MRMRERHRDLEIGDVYYRKVGETVEVAEVLELGDFGFPYRHVKFRATLFGQEVDGTKVLSVAAFLENYLPRAEYAA